MVCSACGTDNSSEAQFCGNCGFSMVTGAPVTPPPPAGESQPALERLSATAIPAEAPVRISIFSGAVGLFILGLITGGLVELQHDPLLAASAWVGLGVGFAAAVWLSPRLRIVGRLPSAVGMASIFIGSYIVLVGVRQFGFYLASSFFGITGLGLGLLFPVTFWRHITRVSPVGKVTFTVFGIAGLAAGWLMGSSAAVAWAGLVALFIGLPSVLFSPILRSSEYS